MLALSIRHSHPCTRGPQRRTLFCLLLRLLLFCRRRLLCLLLASTGLLPLQLFLPHQELFLLLLQMFPVSLVSPQIPIILVSMAWRASALRLK